MGSRLDLQLAQNPPSEGGRRSVRQFRLTAHFGQTLLLGTATENEPPGATVKSVASAVLLVVSLKGTEPMGGAGLNSLV